MLFAGFDDLGNCGCRATKCSYSMNVSPTSDIRFSSLGHHNDEHTVLQRFAPTSNPVTLCNYAKTEVSLGTELTPYIKLRVY